MPAGVLSAASGNPAVDSAGRRLACARRYASMKETHRTHGQNCKDGRPQESDGYDQVNRLSEVQQADADREACEGPRARRCGRNLYFVLGVRFLRKAISARCDSQRREPGLAPGFLQWKAPKVHGWELVLAGGIMAPAPGRAEIRKLIAKPCPRGRPTARRGRCIARTASIRER